MENEHFSHNEEKEILDWHLKILAERKAAVREGRTFYIDWEVAKVAIRESIKPRTEDV